MEKLHETIVRHTVQGTEIAHLSCNTVAKFQPDRDVSLMD